jgi:nucleoid-associated protein YgaU
MRRLAERSTRGEGTVGSEDGSSRDFEPYEPGEGRSARPRSGREEDEPAEWQGGRSRWGGEAKAGRNRATPVRADGPRQPGYAPCGKAGVEVEGAGWYVVQSGDTLSSIAHAHYGSGRAYWRILGANWRTIPDPGLIYACQRIYIPR